MCLTVKVQQKFLVEIDNTSTSQLINKCIYCHNYPLLAGSIECTQRVIEDPHTAVKMVCSNLQCTKSGLLHSKCFDRLEKHLLKAQAATPMGKKWTEAQLKANVWNCRGLDILHRFSKCPCGGTLSKAEEKKNKPPFPTVKKKEKLNQKPKLNCDGIGIGVKISYSQQNRVTEEDTHIRSTQFTYPKGTEDMFKSRPEKHPEAGESSDTKIDPLQVYVGDLPNDCNEDDLEELFKKFGTVRYVRIYHPPTHCDYFVPSFAFVAFDSSACVQRVLAARSITLNGNHRIKVEEKKIRAPFPSEKQPMLTKASKAKLASFKASSKSKQLPPRFLPLLKADLTKNRRSKENEISRGYNKEDVRKILHVSNLPGDCCTNDLGEMFEEYGKVSGAVESNLW